MRVKQFVVHPFAWLFVWSDESLVKIHALSEDDEDILEGFSRASHVCLLAGIILREISIEPLNTII